MGDIVSIKGFRVGISKEEVFRDLDCVKGKRSYDIFSEEFDALSTEISAYMEPGAYFRECTFPGNLACDGLKAGDRVICALYTIGERISGECTEAFSEGDYVRGMLVNAMADSALFSMEKQLIEELRIYCAERRIGVTDRFYACDEETMPLQRFVFQAIQGEQFGLSLTSGYMLKPLKSNALVLKLGGGEDVFRARHTCSHCSRLSCKRREVKEMRLTIVKGEKEYHLTSVPGVPLLDVLREAKIYIPAPCGGKGNCGKCPVQVKKGVLPATETEKRKFSEKQLKAGWRLACQCVPQMDLTLMIPEEEERFLVVSATDGLENTRTGAENSSEYDGCSEREPERGGRKQKENGVSV